MFFSRKSVLAIGKWAVLSGAIVQTILAYGWTAKFLINVSNEIRFSVEIFVNISSSYRKAHLDNW